MVAMLERPSVTVRPSRDHRLYSVGQLLGYRGEPGLLDNWHHFAETQREPALASGYGASFGRSGVPEVAAFAHLAGVYADIDNALPKDRCGQALRLYFRGMIDTRPTLPPDGRANPTFGLFIKPTTKHVRWALHCDANIVPDLIYWALVALLLSLCGVESEEAETRAERWWGKRNRGWEKTRLP